MFRNSSAERLTEALARTQQERELQRAPGITIAISRQAGANGSKIARAIGQRLHWPVYDRELIEMLADRMGVRQTLVEGLDERRTHWLRECIDALAGTPTVSDIAFLHRLAEALVSLAAQGECIIVGRAASQILPKATTLRVRLVAPLAYRIAVVQQRRGVDRETAARWVEATDRERNHFVSEIFRVSPPDPENHDLVLNTARLSATECADLIIVAMRHAGAGYGARSCRDASAGTYLRSP